MKNPKIGDVWSHKQGGCSAEIVSVEKNEVVVNCNGRHSYSKNEFKQWFTPAEPLFTKETVEEKKVSCLTNTCSGEQKFKGLCNDCYGGAKRLINKGETTWDELANMGMAHANGDLFVETFRKARHSEKN